MLTVFLRLGAFYLTLPVSTMMLIRAQPYHDHDLRDLLLPDGCPAPCFMGIQPGLTTMREAFSTLENNPGVADISAQVETSFGSVAVTWQWNGQQSAIFDSQQSGTLYVAYTQATATQIVRSIELPLVLPAGYIALLLGDLPEGDSGVVGGGQRVYVASIYREQAVMISATITCPVVRWRLWALPITLHLSYQLNDVRGLKPFKDVCRP